MKKKLLIIIVIILICIISYLSYNKNTLKLTLDKNLSDNVKEHIGNSIGVELSYADSENIYGHFYNSHVNNVILESSGIFKYNIKTSEFMFIPYVESKRIMSFYWLNNLIYYVILEEEENKFHWELCTANKNFDDVKILKSGKIESPLNYPRILYNKKSLFLVSIDDIDEEKQLFQFDLIEESGVLNLKQDVGYKMRKKGNLIFNIANIYIENNSIYYTIVDEKNIQYLYSFNVENFEEKMIYKNKDYDRILYNYKTLNEGLYIQLALKNENDKSMFIYRKDNSDIINKKGSIKTLDTKSSSCIIFHNQTNDIEIFSENDMKIYKKSINIPDMYPKFLIIDDKIIMQDFSNRFYISNSLKKICK